jgi:amino acid adenylation domain-containing protein
MALKNVEDVYPLSPMQQGILFHDLYDPRQKMYFMQIAWEVEGEINLALFESAWQQVVARHPALRTIFVWEGLDEPLQVVRHSVKMTVGLEDWRGVEPGERDARLREWLQADKKRGFNLTAAPPMRVTLLQTSGDTYFLVWSFHHLLLDGWSTSIVHNEVFFLYEANRRAESLTLPSIRPFRDYVAWSQKQDSSQAEAYWREMLAGVVAPTALAETNGRGDQAPGGNHAYKYQVFDLPEESTSALQTLARRRQLTLNTMVQGAWALVLARYSGERDVLFGVTVSGRPSSLLGAESMVGMFVNTLPIRVRVEPGERLLDWLAQLQKRQAEMRRFEHTSLVEVQGWSDVPRGGQLFESFITFENLLSSDPSAEDDGAFKIRNVGILLSETGYPLSVIVEPGRKLRTHILYDTGLFDEAAVKRLGEYLLVLLERMNANPEQLLSELSALTAEERGRQLVEWNRTAVEYPRDDSVAAEFERQAALTPDAVALVFGERQMTYGELNRRANQLAHHLRGLGVGPEMPVAVCVERSVEMVVGLLGILKAGGFYVPLDPSNPLKRTEAILEDVRPPVLLTQQRLAEYLPASALHVIELDADWPLVEDEPGENPGRETSGENLIYVMFTSGSTGKPKGVGATNRGVMRLVKGTDFAALDAGQVFAQLAPLSFDASTFEIWGSLLNGARLVVMPPHSPSLEELGAALERHGVTTLWLTAGLFHLVVAERVEILRPLRQLLAGGDALAPQSVNRALVELDGCQLINGYGPTETTTFACCYRVPREGFAARRTPIGRPIANTEVFVLGGDGEPAPVGVVGELYVGGDGLARGYHNQPALTAERFVPNPFSEEPGARLYRTGDLARHLPDGSIEFVGRRDNQVKVRGFRIELGEIETALSRHPLVREAVVVARDEAGGEKQLVAYVVGGGESARAPELRAFLGEQLPDYMVPAHFVALDSLPLNANGKVDRRRLPAPEARGEGEFVAPRTPTEEKLAAIWAEVIGVERVGAEDNFFELGGHSLLATQVVSRLTEPFGVELPLRVIFETRTLAELAAHMDELTQQAAAQQETTQQAAV